jgi:cob(I)alamin adenosyltransferase
MWRMRMKVVTKTGDGGKTTLYRKRVDKTSNHIKLLGELDAVVSAIGAFDNRTDLQDLIYKMMSIAAGYLPKEDLAGIIDEEISTLNTEDIAKEFVRPSNTKHLIRVQVRRAEIAAWEAEEHSLAKALNRLSDLYFILAEVGNESKTYFKNSGGV